MLPYKRIYKYLSPNVSLRAGEIRQGYLAYVRIAYMIGWRFCTPAFFSRVQIF